jgi:nucleotide-binding universal stress UspA family protein
MSIICGIDFSENSRLAARAAAAIATRSGSSLKLVHVVDELASELGIPIDQSSIQDSQRRRLLDVGTELRTDFNIDVEGIVASGLPYEKLNEIAVANHANLIVVSSLGPQKQQRWLLGSVAERVAQTSSVPILVVRDNTSIEAWASGNKVLRTMVGVEFGPTSKAALRWAAGLRSVGRCDLFITHVAWPFGEHARFGIPGPVPLDKLRPELHDLVMRDLRELAGEIPGEGETKFSVNPCWGRVDAHLVQLATETQADLLVVGTHQRAGIARFWQGSVSRGVLHEAPCNVACVPPGERVDADIIPTFRRVLIPTDFSPLANRAIPTGYGLVAPGGVVHLLHVITRLPGEDDTNVAERLRALIPKGAAAKGIATELEVLQETNASAGICHRAAQLGVDVICMATHGRSGISKVILGSQTQEVVRHATQLVLLVPPEHET